MTRICLDASFILDVVLITPVSDKLETMLLDWSQAGIEIIAPPIFESETTSVLRNKLFRQVLSEEVASLAFNHVRNMPVSILNLPDLQQRAWALAERFNHSRAYDAQYLAVAEHERCEFWTTDKRLYNSVQPSLPWVKLATATTGDR